VEEIQPSLQSDKNNWYSITPLIQINWDDESSGYAENPDNWILLWK